MEPPCSGAVNLWIPNARGLTTGLHCGFHTLFMGFPETSGLMFSVNGVGGEGEFEAPPLKLCWIWSLLLCEFACGMWSLGNTDLELRQQLSYLSVHIVSFGLRVQL